MGQVVHVAHTVAEQGGVRADRVQPARFGRLDQAAGREMFAVHEGEIGAAEAAGGKGGQGDAVLQVVQKPAALGDNLGAYRARQEAVEHAPARAPAQGGQDHEHLSGVLRVAQQAADGAQGGEGAERGFDGGGLRHDRLP